jgi:hypothetical protein
VNFQSYGFYQHPLARSYSYILVRHSTLLTEKTIDKIKAWNGENIKISQMMFGYRL